MGLTSMIKAVAQMRNLRRGHDTQGRLKRLYLDSSSEGYSNFMAPLRMKMVDADAEYVRKHSSAEEADKIFTKDILRPSTDTYLTPEWDEFVPFPTSKSTYFSHSYCLLLSPLLSHSDKFTNSLLSMENPLRRLWALHLRWKQVPSPPRVHRRSPRRLPALLPTPRR
jgi:hypothetical protein